MKLWPPSVPLPQRDTPELLDSRVFSKAEVARSLRDVARINGFLGATRPLYESVLHLIESAGLKHATVLDIGAGNGDFAQNLLRQAARRNIELRVIALDISHLHLEIAHEAVTSSGRGRLARIKNHPKILHRNTTPLSLVQADAFHLPIRDLGVDIVTSSLFLHHFRPEAIQELLTECTRVALLGWGMNDCTRDALALWSFRVLRPYLARSFITRFDAPASIHRAYTPAEMRAIIAPLQGATVHDYFPYRLQVEWHRPES